jgi:hypothetical protein
MKEAVVTLYKWDANLQRSIPVEVKQEEVQQESVFTSDELAAILKAVLSIK